VYRAAAGKKILYSQAVSQYVCSFFIVFKIGTLSYLKSSDFLKTVKKVERHELKK
jgi:hypothetical protein